MPVRRTSNHIPVEELDAPPKQGIVTILGADCDKNSKAGSIRRTLSADMSSKKWLHQNGFFSSMKKIVSSQEIADEEELNHTPNQDQVWRSIQAQKEKNELQNPPQTGVWGLILTQKSDNSLLQPPYIHPLVKRTKSSLTEKSLEVCTESLGSETGSDCFSSHELSSDGEEERERSDGEEMQRSDDDPFADLHVVKYKKLPPRSFPPPLPSIAGGDGGSSLHMHSHRENGRLVLEAVSVAPRKYFHARRHDGRLLLTLKHAPANLEAEEEKESEVEAAVVERKSEESLVEQNLSLPTGMISVHKSGLVMKKLMAVGNINPKWGNEASTREGGEVPQLLPPRPPVGRLAPPAMAASFNNYEYFWRSKPGFMTSNKNGKMNQDLVMYMRGCKEARRSLIWEPYCIATS